MVREGRISFHTDINNIRTRSVLDFKRTDTFSEAFKRQHNETMLSALLQAGKALR